MNTMAIIHTERGCERKQPVGTHTNTEKTAETHPELRAKPTWSDTFHQCTTWYTLVHIVTESLCSRNKCMINYPKKEDGDSIQF